MGVRNIFHTGLLDALGKDYHIIMYSPYKCGDHERDGIDPNSVKRGKHIRFLYSILYTANYYALWFKHKPRTLNKYINRDLKEKPIKYVLYKVLSWCVLKIRKNKQFDFIRDIAYRNRANIFTEIDALFVTSTDCQEDKHLMYGAKKAGLPVIVLVHSWDNLPARGLLPVIPDALLVWNNIMKQQAITLHGMSCSDVYIIGVPQYQYYKKLGLELDESQFLRKYCGKSIKNKVVLYTCSATRVFPDEELFIDELIEVMYALPNIQLVIRLHPEERKNTYQEKYADSPNIILSIPDDSFRAKRTNSVGEVQSIDEFVMLMKYSAVVINMGSTITLDATLFDTPAICPMFNINHDPESWNAAMKWYDSSHLEAIVNSNAVDFPLNFKELLDCVRIAINSPEYKSSERENLRKNMLPDIDSAKIISDIINKVTC